MINSRNVDNFNFADLMPDDIFTRALGDDVIYGDETIRAIVNYSVNAVSSNYSHLTENCLQLDVAVADAPGLKKGSKFMINGKKYLVDDIIKNDGHFISCVLKVA